MEKDYSNKFRSDFRRAASTSQVNSNKWNWNRDQIIPQQKFAASYSPITFRPNKWSFSEKGFWSYVFYPILLAAATFFIAVILTLILVLREQSKSCLSQGQSLFHFWLLWFYKFVVTVNEASLMMRRPNGNMQTYNTGPSFDFEPFDADDEVWPMHSLIQFNELGLCKEFFGFGGDLFVK